MPNSDDKLFSPLYIYIGGFTTNPEVDRSLLALFSLSLFHLLLEPFLFFLPSSSFFGPSDHPSLCQYCA